MTLVPVIELKDLAQLRMVLMVAGKHLHRVKLAVPLQDHGVGDER